MPPRRRPRKVGQKRMDAAVENMRLLGFSDELVRSTIKRLLEVYEGDSGWLFIEEGSYKLLVDTILDEQENSLLKGDSSEVNARDDNNTSSAARALARVDAASPTDEIGDEDCNPAAEDERTDERDINLDQNPTRETGDEDCNPAAEDERTDERDINLDQNPMRETGDEDCNPAAEDERTDERDINLDQNPTREAGDEDCNPAAEDERTDERDINLDQNPTREAGDEDCNPAAEDERTDERDINLDQNPTRETGDEGCNPAAEDERTDERDINLDQNQNHFHSPPPLISSAEPVDSLVMQKRRRFCGWISDDEPDDIDTMLQLIPATAIQLERLIRGTDPDSKSKWDEKPE